MSAHMRERHTDSHESLCVILKTPNAKKVSYSIPLSRLEEVEAFLEKQCEDDDSPVAWKF